MAGPSFLVPRGALGDPTTGLANQRLDAPKEGILQQLDSIESELLSLNNALYNIESPLGISLPPQAGTAVQAEFSTVPERLANIGQHALALRARAEALGRVF